MSNPKLFKPAIIGWDIGGAHLKAVVLDANGVQLHCIQLPCALWRGLTELELGVKAVFNQIGLQSYNVLHAVTMTGELVDLFPNRYSGVCEIAKYAVDLLGQNTFFYAANNGFVTLDDVAKYSSDIASTNWHASASFLAKYVENALLIDIGSTTSDIIPIKNGLVAMQGISDSSRMQHDALVYTGVVRTPIMALAQKLTLSDAVEEIEMNVAAEFFATMADVYRLTDELPLAKDMAETADGKGKTQQDSARRLARMLGFDMEDKPIETWVRLAFTCRALQLKQLKAAVLKHLKSNTPIIGAGAGSFLVKALATEMDCEYRPLSDVLKSDMSLLMPMTSGSQLADLEMCFPAYAVARLILTSQLPNKASSR